ncbi:hypothetical protein [Nocardia ignorata]|uniref:Uncharacterized protein n=1 Tax=Nocardia ignorata TaxID=145285 RepID=A0A4R6P210_NOCIG|nr:hypothetical protein [Nocardia ignorata]TDP28420.1 hypothetical protein DFR75_11733 [Nocardia ignorata]
MTVTAQLTSINDVRLADNDDWTSETSFDTITVRDQDGNEVASLTVESSEDPAPYDAALAAAGFTDVTWID